MSLTKTSQILAKTSLFFFQSTRYFTQVRVPILCNSYSSKSKKYKVVKILLKLICFLQKVTRVSVTSYDPNPASSKCNSGKVKISPFLKYLLFHSSSIKLSFVLNPFVENWTYLHHCIRFLQLFSFPPSHLNITTYF